MKYNVVKQYCGHGTGVDFHEEPYILHVLPKQRDRDSGPIMKSGMVFTIEPILNVGTHKVEIADDQWTVKTADQKLSAQEEHTVLVTDTGVEILTQVEE